MGVYGYKGFDENLRCRNMQFEIGKTYETEGNPKTAKNGMHFCMEPFGVLQYFMQKSRKPLLHCRSTWIAFY